MMLNEEEKRKCVERARKEWVGCKNKGEAKKKKKLKYEKNTELK